MGEKLWEKNLWEKNLWEQSLLAIQTPRFLKYRVVPIAGKPCSHSSHSSHSFYSVPTPGAAQLACFICRTGNSTRKVVPTPTSLRTVISPWCFFTMP
ncbi:hypothetical protein D3C78_1622280 [compost metagenome]